jgi:hypothetical protein
MGSSGKLELSVNVNFQQMLTFSNWGLPVNGNFQ